MLLRSATIVPRTMVYISGSKDMKSKRTLRTLTLCFVLATIGCQSSRVSGIYIGNGEGHVERLQLTQTGNGQLAGVLSFITLDSGGKLSTKEASVSGAIDGKSITLTVSSGLSFLANKTLAGTVNGNVITLELVTSNGSVEQMVFKRGTPEEFRSYADGLKTRAEGEALSAALVKGSRAFRQSVSAAENWIGNAELHAQRIPNAKASYDKIEQAMQKLLAQEHATGNDLSRSQIAVQVNQADVAGEQLDVEIDGIWDANIASAGAAVKNDFDKWDGNCGSSDDLRRRGADADAIQQWDIACHQALTEREKFLPEFERIKQQRAQLKSLQVAAQTRRKALVNEADRLAR